MAAYLDPTSSMNSNPGGWVEQYREILGITPETLMHCPYDYKHRVKLSKLKEHVELCREDWIDGCKRFEVVAEKIRCRYCHAPYWIYETHFHHLSCVSYGVVMPKPQKTARMIQLEEKQRKIEELALQCYYNFF